MDMEDGEIPSSPEREGEEDTPSYPPPPLVPHNSAEISFQDDILDDSSYVIIERPKSSLPAAAKSSSPPATTQPMTSSSATKMSSQYSQQQEPPVASMEFSREVQQVNDIYGVGDRTGFTQTRKESYYKKAGVSDLIQSSNESSSASDSDDDQYQGKRSRMAMPMGGNPFQNSNAPGPSPFGSMKMTPSSSGDSGMNEGPSAGLNDFFAHASKFQKQRKPNPIWSNVIQEEEISKGLGAQVRVGGGLAEIEVTRGSETYYYERARRQPRQRRDSDSSEISSEGLSDNALHYLKDDIADEEDKDETVESSEYSLPKSFTSTSTKSGNQRKGTKRRKSTKKHKRKIITKLKKMKSPDLAKYMATKLLEQKVQLLERAIQTLGKERCINTFLKTLKIEKRGGIMVKTQERRRTPGGVFLYLIRGDRRFPKSAIDFIFRDDRAESDKFRKKKLATKRLHKKLSLEDAKAALEKGDMMKVDEKEESESDDTAVLEDNDQDGTTDTGQFGDETTQESSVITVRDTEELSGLTGMQCDGSES